MKQPKASTSTWPAWLPEAGPRRTIAWVRTAKRMSAKIVWGCQRVVKDLDTGRPQAPAQTGIGIGIGIGIGR